MYPSAHGYRHRLWLVSLMTLVSLSICAAADVRDYGMESTLIVKCSTYVSKWPEQKMRTGAPFVIGVIGQDNGLSGLIQEKVSAGLFKREVLVKVFTAKEEIAGCNVLFVSGSELGRQRELIREASRRNVLTFGDTETFEKDGGIITFSKENGEVKFTVNDRNRRDIDLKISSEIFELRNAKVTGRGPR